MNVDITGTNKPDDNRAYIDQYGGSPITCCVGWGEYDPQQKLITFEVCLAS